MFTIGESLHFTGEPMQLDNSEDEEAETTQVVYSLSPHINPTVQVPLELPPPPLNLYRQDTGEHTTHLKTQTKISTGERDMSFFELHNF